MMSLSMSDLIRHVRDKVRLDRHSFGVTVPYDMLDSFYDMVKDLLPCYSIVENDTTWIAVEDKLTALVNVTFIKRD